MKDKEKRDYRKMEKRIRELEQKITSMSMTYEEDRQWTDKITREYESYKATLDLLELYLDKNWRVIGHSNNFLLLTESIVDMRQKGAHLKNFLCQGDFDKIRQYLIKMDEIKDLPFEKGRKWELKYTGPKRGEKIGRDWLPFSFSGKNQWKIEKGRIIHRHRIKEEEDFYLMTAKQFGGAEEDLKVRFKVKTSKDPALISDVSLVLSGASGKAGIHPDLVGYTACSASNGNTVTRIQKRGGVLAVVPEVLDPDTVYEITVERTGGRITREIVNLDTGTKGVFLEAIDTVAIYDRQNHLGFTTYSGDLEIYDLEIFTRKSAFTIDQFRLPFDVEVGIRDKKLKGKQYKLRIGSRESGEETLYMLLFEDITEKKKAEEALRLSEERFRKSFKTSPDSININRMKDGLFVDVNEGFTALTGYSREDVIGRTSLEINLWDDLKDRKRMTGELKQHGQVSNLEAKFCLKDGTVRTGLMSATIITLDEEPHILSITRDIEEWKKAEEDSRQSNERLHAFVSAFPDLVFILDEEGRYVDILSGDNSLLYRRQEELKGRLLHEVMPKEIADRSLRKIRKAIETGKSQSMEYCLDVPAGQRWFEARSSSMQIQAGNKRMVVWISRDITARKQAETARKKLEEQLTRAHKMESLGLLAGGVAHDLNNILTGLVSYPDLILLQLAEDDPIREYIYTIKDSGQRAADVVQDLLSLARSGVGILEILNLNDIIGKFMKSPEFENLKFSWPNIRFNTELDPELMNIEGSEVHLLKTLMNLVSNSAEAMSHEGEVTISTCNSYIDKPVAGFDNIQEGDYAVVSVSDNGIGIPAGDFHKIFEPFYSKKMMGRSGTGLGMSVVWSALKDHGGYIDVESTVDKGTTFRLFFPITRKEIAESESKLSISNIMGKGEKILVIDDIKKQRIIATQLLTNLGYAVVSVSSGEEAVEYMQSNSADLLLLDMIMEPGMDGLETYKMILKTHPGQKAVIASGFAETERVREAQKLGAGAYLKKPYTLRKLVMFVRKELDR